MNKSALAKNIGAVLITSIVAVFLGSNLPYLLKQIRGPFKSGNYVTHVAEKPSKLTLYGTTTCPHCETARAYLHKANIPFNDMVIDKSEAAKAAYMRLKENAVPVLVSANRLIVGFDAKAYAELNRIANK